MAQVVVSVQNCGLTVVEQTIVLSNDGRGQDVYIGDIRGALVRYAGPPVRLTARDERVLAGPRRLVAGQACVVQERSVRVTVELVAARGFETDWPRFDPRMLVATAALVLFAWWLDSIGVMLDPNTGPAAPDQRIAAPGIYIP